MILLMQHVLAKNNGIAFEYIGLIAFQFRNSGFSVTSSCRTQGLEFLCCRLKLLNYTQNIHNP